MPSLRAVLLYPGRRGASARARPHRPWLALLPVLPAAGCAGWLLLRGVASGDALVAGLAVAVVLIGMAAGGALASWPAARLAGARIPLRALAAPCAVAACWAALLLVVVARAFGAAGGGSVATLVAALLVLLHGVAAGFAIVRADEAEDVGRGGVASCLGLAGALVGCWLALAAVQGSLLLVLRAPVTLDEFRAGDLLLVRRARSAPPGSLVLLRDDVGREGLFARIDAQGAPRALGGAAPTPDVSTEWDIHGRIFLVVGSDGARPIDATESVPR